MGQLLTRRMLLPGDSELQQIKLIQLCGSL